MLYIMLEKMIWLSKEIQFLWLAEQDMDYVSNRGSPAMSLCDPHQNRILCDHATLESRIQKKSRIINEMVFNDVLLMSSQ